MAKTKNQIAQEMYGEDFDDLSGGYKAQVTKALKKSPSRARPRKTAGVNAVVVKIGRIGVNGMKECCLDNGATVEDLVEQSDFTLDEDKEAVNAQSTGMPVNMSDELVDGEAYIITTEIKSA